VPADVVVVTAVSFVAVVVLLVFLVVEAVPPSCVPAPVAWVLALAAAFVVGPCDALCPCVADVPCVVEGP
jgi:hypothetical protein